MNRFEGERAIIEAPRAATAKSSENPAVETAPALKISFFEFVTLIAALMALTALSIDIMLPALPQIGTALGVKSENDRQLIIVLYMAGFAVGQLIYGPLSDRIGRKPALMAGLAIFVAGTLGALLSGSFESLLAARLVQGVGAASPRVVALAVVRDLYSGRQMARVMSFAMMVFIIIPVLAPSLGQGLLHLGDWHLTFYALLALGLAVTVWSALRLPETARAVIDRSQRESLLSSFKDVIMEPRTVVYGAAGGFMFGCLLAYVASAQQVFVDVFALGDYFPIVFGAVASVMAIASFANSRLVGPLGMRRVSHTALVGFVIVAILLCLAVKAGAANVWVFAGLISAEFFLFGLIAPNFNALAMEPQGRNAGMASSVIGGLSTAIGATAGGVIGRMFDGTPFPLALGFAGCSLITLAMIYALEGKQGFLGRNRTLETAVSR